MCVACFGAARVGGKPKLPDAVGNGSVLRTRCLLHVRLALAAAVKRMSFSCDEVCEQMNLVETLSNVS